MDEQNVPARTLIAFDPAELKQSQESLLHWLTEKFNICLDEEKQFAEAATIAEENNWKNSGTIKSAASRAKYRSNYYDKAVKAVEAGYILIPPFPLAVFAVRTTRKKPIEKHVKDKWSIGGAQPSANAPAGEGEYVDNEVFYKHAEFQDPVPGKPGQTVTRHDYWASDYAQVEFPMEACKPELMERASEAMKLSIFDEIGLVGEARRDPILVGSVILKEAWTSRRMNFFLAWWIDKQSL